MNILLYGLQVTLIGMLVVFVGLIILIGFIRVIKTMLAGEGKMKSGAAKQEETGAPLGRDSMSAAQDATLIAVIAAAVAAAMGGEGKDFVIRNVRRVRSAPAWGRAGREEQIYSRM